MDTKRDALLNLICFLAENPRVWWYIICDDNPDAETASELIELLLQKEIYSLIPVVIGRSKSLEVENILHKLFLNKLCECWSQKSAEEIAEEIRGLLKTIRQKKKE